MSSWSLLGVVPGRGRSSDAAGCPGDAVGMFQGTVGCSGKLQDAQGCCGVLWDAAGYPGILHDTRGCCGKPWDALGCCGITWDALRSCRMLCNVPGCCRMPWDAVGHVPPALSLHPCTGVRASSTAPAASSCSSSSGPAASSGSRRPAEVICSRVLCAETCGEAAAAAPQRVKAQPSSAHGDPSQLPAKSGRAAASP